MRNGRLVVSDAGNGRLQIFAADGEFLETIEGSRPAPAAGEVSAQERRDLEKAWRRVLAGDGRAVRDYQKVLERRPGLVAAETGLAFAQLRGGQVDAATAAFDVALAEQPDYVPALVGAGSAALSS